MYLQDALGEAVAGDTVWVAAGNYYPDEGAGQTNNSRTSTFSIPDAVVVLGGFAGDETDVTQREWAANTTMLSGDIDQAGSNAGNAYHAVLFHRSSAQTVLDGFTVSGGNANGPSFESRGGGIYADGSGSSCAPRITNCTVSGNSAERGAAVYNNGYQGTCSPVFANCAFSGNDASYKGGGVFNSGHYGTSSPILTNCAISGNTALYGGGIYNEGSGGTSSPTLTNCIVSGNSGTYHGGGIYSEADVGTSSPVLTNCIISGNYTPGSGAGVYNYCSGHIDQPAISIPVLTNCTFSGNRAAASGGAMYGRSDWGTLTPTLINCILWGNSGSSMFGASPEVYNNGGAPTFDHCCIAGSGSASWNTRVGTDNGGNIDADPLFVSPVNPSTAPTTAGDFALKDLSSCIDAATATGAPSTDMLGMARVDFSGVTNTGSGTPDYIDIGAFERQVHIRNYAPTIDPIADPAPIYEDFGVQVVSLSGIGDNDYGEQTLQITATSDNPSVIANPTVSFDWPQSTLGELSYTPVANAFGTATITVRLQDNGGTANGGVDTALVSFTITVIPINDAPSFTGVGDVTVNEDCGPQTVSEWATDITAGPNEESQALSFSVVTDNEQLYSQPPSVDAFTGDLTFTPAADAHGSATVAVTLYDDGGLAYGGTGNSGTLTFTLTVNPVNDAPSFVRGGDQTVDEDCGAQSVLGWATAMSAGPANEATQTLTLTATTDNDALFSALPAVDPSTGDLTYTPAADAYGSATVSVSLTDNGGTANGGVDSSGTQTLTITVNAVNDAPLVAGIADQTIDEGGSFSTIALDDMVGDIDNSPEEMDWSYSGNVALSVSIDPATRIVTITTPSSTWFGAETIAFIATDPGGLEGADGAVLTVNAVNEQPVVDAVSDAVIQADGTWSLQLTASDPDGDTLVFELRTWPDGMQLDTAAGLLSWAPSEADTGTYTVSVGVLDGHGGEATCGFAITVEPAVGVKQTRGEASRTFASPGELLASPNPAPRGASMSFLVLAAGPTAVLTIHNAGGGALYEREHELRPGPTRDARLLLGPWNLTDDSGRPVPGGTYLAQVSGRDGNGNAVRYRILVGVRGQ